ncbi:SLAC1 family transporter [Moraxella macacae]|uniref:SLAC1 family transporter n=1 Tax=Moraxella macacae TaxID=765840 RepID=UPI00058AD6BE|nr:tellurite resistance protein TehA [Moraxella macacae]
MLPASYFAVPLGLGALAIAWYRAESVFELSHAASFTLGGLSFATWTLFLAIYVYKAIHCPAHFLDELRCPVRFALLSLIPITIMVMGELMVLWGKSGIDYMHGLGTAFILIGVISQLAYGTWRIGTLWRGDTFTQTSTLPPFYLPAVAANFTSASALALIGYKDIGQLFFGAGLFAWLIFEPVLLQHLRTTEINEKLRASLGVILAPAFVGAASYLSITGEVDFFVKMLWGYGFLQLLFLLRLLPWIAHKGIDASFWSFSFGLASMANGAMLFYKSPAFKEFGMAVFVFANLAMLILMGYALLHVWQGKFFKIAPVEKSV